MSLMFLHRDHGVVTTAFKAEVYIKLNSDIVKMKEKAVCACVFVCVYATQVQASVDSNKHTQ